MVAIRGRTNPVAAVSYSLIVAGAACFPDLILAEAIPKL